MSTILITGATDGIGLECARQLSRNGHDLVLHGRSEEKAQRARAAILRVAPNATTHLMVADLADLGAVSRAAEDLSSRLHKLDVLMNNAGVYMTRHTRSRDGFEMTLAVNHIAHFLLTTLLLPLLNKSSSPRVITVSSIAHTRGALSFDNMNGERHFDAYQAYANSKLANVLFALELARREPWLTSNSLHPGVIDTKLLHTGFSASGDPVETVARTTVFLAESDRVAGITGKYFDDCAATAPSAIARDEQLAEKLWAWTAHSVQPWQNNRPQSRI